MNDALRGMSESRNAEDWRFPTFQRRGHVKSVRAPCRVSFWPQEKGNHCDYVVLPYENKLKADIFYQNLQIFVRYSGDSANSK